MQQYFYEALDPDGKKVRGKTAGDSLAVAGASLRSRGYTITRLEEQGAKEAGQAAVSSAETSFNNILVKLGRVKQTEVILFLRQLAALIKAGVSIVLSLSILESQSGNRKFKYVLSRVRRDVEAGNPLSDALEQFPRIFPPMVTNILRTGETSGLLDTAIERIVSYWEDRLALKTLIITSVMYPVIVLLVSIAIIIFMVTFVIPSMVGFLESVGGELPWTTELLVNVSEFLMVNLSKMGQGLVLLVLLGVGIYHVPAGRYAIHKYMIRLPVVGAIFQYTIIVFFAKTLSMLIESGVPIVDALKSTRDTMGNVAVKRIIDRMVDRVLYGENLSEPLLEAKRVFPPMVGNMVKVGEETGGVDSALEMVAGIYNKLLEVTVKRMISLIEPALLVLMGGMVGFIAVSLIGAILASYSGSGM